MYKIVLISILFFGFACKKGKKNPSSCNGKNTRRSIKIAVDEQVGEIDTTVIVATIDSLENISVGKVDKNTPRIEVEKRIYRVRARVHKVSKHRDGDYKIKLTNGNDQYINCESPNVGCEFIDDSPYLSQMQVVRNFIELHRDELEGEVVTITGIGFIDIDHKFPRNAAKNEIEIHPILEIDF